MNTFEKQETHLLERVFITEKLKESNSRLRQIEKSWYHEKVENKRLRDFLKNPAENFPAKYSRKMSNKIFMYPMNIKTMR